MTHQPLEAVVIAFVLCALFIVVTKPLLARFATDLPNDRSSHASPTPRGGGLSLAAATLLVMLYEVGVDARVLALTGALGGLASLGLADDIRSLAPGPRLGCQFALGLVAACAVLDLGSAWSDYLAVGAAVLLVVASINAFNFMDGINGISGATAIVAAGWYWWLGTETDGRLLVAISMGVLGAALAFMLWNAGGTLFLGDSGSYFLGGVLAVMAVTAMSGGADWWKALAPFGPYAADTCVTAIRRAVRGESLMQAHREHVYQRLAARGIPHLKVAGLVGVATATCCAVSLIPWLAGIILLWAAVALSYLSSPWLIARTDRLRT